MRIAAVQTSPVWGKSEETATVVTEWIEKAAMENVDLAAFGEAFLSGYPYWLYLTEASEFDSPQQKEAYAYYLAGAVDLGGPEMEAIKDTVAETGVFTYLGVTERSSSGGTIYACYVAIDPVQGVVSAHRKLMPTYDERMVWGIGDGHGLRTHQVGEFTVSGLNCWENWVPTIRHVMYAQGTTLHVAGWPGSVWVTKDITRFIALEGRCYVLSAGSILNSESIPEDFPLRQQIIDDGFYGYENGGSAIAAPDGSWLVEPVRWDEGLVMADIDPAVVRGERQNFDAAGHYFRADVIDVTVNRARLGPAHFVD